MSGPLEGVRVVDLTAVLMGPSATQMLGDLGADVIKVEPPTGDTTRRIGPGRSESMGSNFLNMNRNKRSLALDLKHPRSQSVVARLIANADVFIHNIRPQAARRLNLTYADVCAIKPDIIYCALTGFGSDGPYAGQPAYDDLIQGMSALPSLYAACGDSPRYVPTPIADRVAGLNAVVAVLGALFHKHRTGVGQAIEVPMFECVAHMVLADHMYGRTFVPPLGEPGYTRVLSPSRHPYKTLDGWLCVLIYNDRHWQSFFRLVKREDLYADPRFASMRSRNDHIDELYGIVADTLRDRTSAEWIVLLQSVDIPVAPMNSLDNLLDDQHLASVGFFETAQHPTEGTINTMRTPITWSESKPQYRYAAPNLGEHCVEVLRENGFSSSEIESLTHAGVFGAAVSQV